MDRLELYSGGFPLTTKTLEHLQDAYSNAIKALTAMGGNTFILSGLNVTGTIVSDGAIVYNGEYLPFVGGTYNDTVSIYEDVENVIYNSDADTDGDLDSKRAYIKRYAACGTDGLTSFSFNQLKTFTPLTQLSTPTGAIIMWGGLIGDIPSGWVLCDGSNGTPNLVDRFLVGAGNNYNIGDIGGSDEVALTESEMPTHNHPGTTSNSGIHKHTGSTYAAGSHKHNYTAYIEYGSNDGSGGEPAGNFGTQETGSGGSHSHSLNMDNAGEHNHTVTTEDKGNNQAHENRPPYYAVAYIMFKGF